MHAVRKELEFQQRPNIRFRSIDVWPNTELHIPIVSCHTERPNTVHTLPRLHAAVHSHARTRPSRNSGSLRALRMRNRSEGLVAYQFFYTVRLPVAEGINKNGKKKRGKEIVPLAGSIDQFRSDPASRLRT